MKIAILVGQFPPRWQAGTEIATWNMARALASRGHDVHVLTTLDQGLPAYSEVEGFNLHRLKIIKRPVLGSLSLCNRIFNEIKKLKPDVIHAQTIGMARYAWWPKKLLGIPYVIYGRGDDVYVPPPFSHLPFRQAVRDASALIALTGDMAQAMQRQFKRDAEVIPNGIDAAAFSGLDRLQSRRKLNIQPDKKVLVFVGTLRPMKGVRYLIYAMKAISVHSPGVLLVIAGGGGEIAELQEMVKREGLSNNVRFEGKILNSQVPEYLAASDVFVLPSLSEGFPVSVLEAMAAGLPIVATRIGALTDIIQDGVNGLLVEPNSPADLSLKINSLLDDPGLESRTKENNLAEVQNYSWERVARSLEYIYGRATKNGK